MPSVLGGSAADDVMRTVEIRNFVGRVSLEEGAFALGRQARGMLRGSETAMVFDAGQNPAHYRCDVHGGSVWVDNAGIDDAGVDGAGVRFGNDIYLKNRLDAFPLIAITAPDRSVKVVVKDSILFGEMADLDGLDVGMSNCGSLDVGDVGGTLSVALAGQAELDVDDVDVVRAALSEESLMRVERVGALNASVADGAELRVQDLLSGSVSAGEAARIELERAEGFTAELRDVAVLRVKELRGQSGVALLGTSRFEVDIMDAERVEVRASERSTARLDGVVRHADLVSAGNAEIALEAANTSLAVRAEDASEIHVARGPGRVKRPDAALD